MRLQPAQSANSLLVYGDLVNNTGAPQALISISGTFRDGQGQVIADSSRTSDFWPTDVIPPSGRLPFELIVTGIRGAASYALEVRSEVRGETPRQDFEFTNLTQFNERGAYCVTATFRNPRTDLVEYLAIVSVLFDSQSSVISFSDPFEPELGAVAGGQTLDVKLCSDALGQPVARYELRAWGR